MERNGIGMISLHYSAQNYISLNLSVEQSSEADWNTAINILKERFEERYFSTIHYLSFDFTVRRKTIEKFEKMDLQ